MSSSVRSGKRGKRDRNNVLHEIPKNSSRRRGGRRDVEEGDTASMASSKSGRSGKSSRSRRSLRSARSHRSQKSVAKAVANSQRETQPTETKLMAGFLKNNCTDVTLVIADAMEAFLLLLENSPLQHNQHCKIPIREIVVPCCPPLNDSNSDQVSCLEGDMANYQNQKKQAHLQYVQDTTTYSGAADVDQSVLENSLLESPQPQPSSSASDDNDFEEHFRIQWSVHRNVLPGLDKWEGVLGNASEKQNKDAPSLGLVEGFWIQQDWQERFDSTEGSESERLDLSDVHKLNESLGHFCQIVQERGWPDRNDKDAKTPTDSTAPPLSDLQTAGEETTGNEDSASRKQESPKECCFISHVWIAEEHRGQFWGLALVEKANQIMPRRYKRRQEEEEQSLQQKQEPLEESQDRNREPEQEPAVPVVLAVPPYNAGLRKYFANAGWKESWDVDFLVK